MKVGENTVAMAGKTSDSEYVDLGKPTYYRLRINSPREYRILPLRRRIQRVSILLSNVAQGEALTGVKS